MSRTLRGVLPIAHTPFTGDDEIDLASLRREVDWAFAQGADGFGTGMVSEILRLTADERTALANHLVEMTAGRGAVFMAVGAESTRQTVAFTKAAAAAGCDAVMAVPPLTTRLTEVALVDHFRALAEAVEIPLIVQDASSYVGQAIPLGVYVKLLDRYGPGKVLFKPEAAPNGPNISALRDATGGQARIFEGSGGVYLIDSYRRGVAGTMPGVDLLDGVAAVWRALERGDEEAAYRVYFPVAAIVTLQLQAGLDGFLAVEKYLMVNRGLFAAAHRRRPYHWELDAETAAEVDRLFGRLRSLIPSPPPSGGEGALDMRYVVLAFLCAATVIAYVQRTALSVPSKVIEGELAFGPDDMAWVMAAWYFAYAVFQLPSGWLADRLGSKPALVLFAATWSVCTGAAGLAGGFTGLLLLWGLMGAAQAGIFPCATRAVGATFPPTGQAFASGMLACCMALGGAVGPKATGELLGPLAWQEILAAYAVPGLVWAAVFALAVRRPDAPAPAAGGAPVRWSKLATDRQMQLLCGQQFLRASAIAFFYTWFPRYLQETRGLDTQESGALAAWPPFAGMFGGLVGGLLSDWLLRTTGRPRLSRQGMAFSAMVVCTVVAVAAYHVADPRVAVLLISAGAFCGMMGGVSGYAVAIAFGGTRVATVFATMNMCGNVGAALFPLAVGYLVAATGRWDLTLLLFAGLFAADAVLWVLLNPTKPLFEDGDAPR